MTIRFAVALGTLLVAVSAGAQPRQAEAPLLVSTAWLADRLQDPNVVVLQTSQGAAARDQIPGARLVPHDSLMTMSANHDLASASELVAALEQAGVSNTSHVVIYGEPLASGWLFFALDYLGHGRMSMLDGGLDKWRTEGRPLRAVGPPPPRARFQAQLRPQVKASAEVVQNRTASAVALVDARSEKSTAQGTSQVLNFSRGRTCMRTRSCRHSRVQKRWRRYLRQPVRQPARPRLPTAKSACDRASCILPLGTQACPPATTSAPGVSGRQEACPQNQRDRPQSNIQMEPTRQAAMRRAAHLRVTALKRIPLKTWQPDTGKSQVVLIDARRGRRQPHAKHRKLLVAYARKRGVL